MKHNQFITEIKEFNEEQRTITMIGSTEAVDRTGDIVKMAGVDLANYKKNPIILFNHDYDKPIGKALDVQVVDAKLIFKIQFADTDFGREIYYLYKNGYMSASSIGFIGKEYEPNEHGGITFTKIELLELSMVSVPCNPTAIVQLRKDFEANKVSKDMYKELGGTIEDVKKAGETLSDDKLEVIKEAINLLQGLLSDKPEEKEEEVNKSADTANADETGENIENEEEEEEKEESKSFSNEEIIKEILKHLEGK